MLWGVLLTIIEWLAYLAAKGGLAQSAVWAGIISLAVYGYVGYSAFKLSGRPVQAMLTAMLAGLVSGFLGSLTLLLEPHVKLLAGLVLVIENGFATALFAVALGAVGVSVARLLGRLRHAK